jgi:hypothetical protein
MRRGDASGTEKLFFVVVGNRATIAARSSPNFANCRRSNFGLFKFSKIKILQNRNCKFCEIENEKTFPREIAQNRKEESSLAARGSLQAGEAPRAA